MENKIGRYLKYAIGEIILVVIGIIIALEINNWNENRKQNIRAAEYHQRIYQDFENLTRQSNNLLNRADKILRSITKTVELLESGNDLTAEDKKIVDYAMIWFPRTTYQMPTISTYEEMKSNGDLNLIYDVTLRNKITDYNNLLTQIVKVSDNMSTAIQNDYSIFQRYLRNYVDPDTLSVTVSYDFKEMSSDKAFINKFSRLAIHWRGFIYFLNAINQDGLKIMKELAKEPKKT